jgi:biopolymer transport protein ExbD
MARKARPVAFTAPSFQPIATINTTPLIDLMLVLLVMFIVIIPAATHKVPLDLPVPDETPAEPRPVHRLDLDIAGRLFWDGQAITEAQLPQRLAALGADPADPDLHIAAEAETRYERVDETLAEVKRAGITRLGFIGNQRFESELDGS